MNYKNFLKKILPIVASMALFSILLLPVFSLAQNNVCNGTDSTLKPSCCNGTDSSACPTPPKIANPLGKDGPQTLPDFLQIILKGVIKIGIPIIAIMIIYSGFLFVSAQGNSEKLGEAKKALTFTLVGAALLLCAWAIAELIAETVTQIKTTS